MNMSASTVHIANQLPVFKSRDIYELKDYQELLKLLQKYHIQKFLLKSRDELYAYLDNCFKPPSPEKESSFHERESEQSEFENKSDSKQQKLENVKQQIVTQQYAKLEDDSRPQKMETVQPQKKQFLDNLKTLPQIQDFDEEDLKSMLKDLYQDENKNGGKKGHRKRQNLEMMKDDNSYKWPASRVRVVKGLAILIQQRIPYAKILQDFKIAYKTYSYTLFLKDTDDTANLIWSRIKEYGCEIPNMQFRTNQIELIYDMVKLVYEKRDYCRDQIMAICSGVVFQKKLKALKEKAEQKTKCDDIKVVQVTAYLDKINDFVQQGPAMSKYQNGPSECQYLPNTGNGCSCA